MRPDSARHRRTPGPCPFRRHDPRASWAGRALWLAVVALAGGTLVAVIDGETRRGQPAWPARSARSVRSGEPGPAPVRLEFKTERRDPVAASRRADGDSSEAPAEGTEPATARHRLSGHVYFARLPVAGAELGFVAGARAAGWDLTAADGAYEVLLEPGTYAVTVGGDPVPNLTVRVTGEDRLDLHPTSAPAP